MNKQQLEVLVLEALYERGNCLEQKLDNLTFSQVANALRQPIKELKKIDLGLDQNIPVEVLDRELKIRGVYLSHPVTEYSPVFILKLMEDYQVQVTIPLEKQIEIEELLHDKRVLLDGTVAENIHSVELALQQEEVYVSPISDSMDWNARLNEDYDEQYLVIIEDKLEKRGILLSKDLTEYYPGFLLHLISDYPVLK